MLNLWKHRYIPNIIVQYFNEAEKSFADLEKEEKN